MQWSLKWRKKFFTVFIDQMPVFAYFKDYGYFKISPLVVEIIGCQLAF